MPTSVSDRKQAALEPRAIAEPVGSTIDLDPELTRLSDALESCRRENAAPPEYPEARRDPDVWANLLGLWR